MNNFKYLRILKCLSQSRLAKRANIPRWKVSLGDRGFNILSIQEVNRVANLLGVNPDDLFQTHKIKKDET